MKNTLGHVLFHRCCIRKTNDNDDGRNKTPTNYNSIQRKLLLREKKRFIQLEKNALDKIRTCSLAIYSIMEILSS